jgi:hypothetical protein
VSTIGLLGGLVVALVGGSRVVRWLNTDPYENAPDSWAVHQQICAQGGV